MSTFARPRLPAMVSGTAAFPEPHTHLDPQRSEFTKYIRQGDQRLGFRYHQFGRCFGYTSRDGHTGYRSLAWVHAGIMDRIEYHTGVRILFFFCWVVGAISDHTHCEDYRPTNSGKTPVVLGHSSPYDRQFVASNYAAVKAANPNLPILVREAKGAEARIFARFGN